MYNKAKQARFVILLIAILSVVSFWALRTFQEESTNISLSEEEIQQGQIELGRKLFFDKRLSGDNSISCASCHLPELAFTDGKPLAEGVHGRFSMRNAPSLLNVKDATTFMFDAHIATLEEQVTVPIQEPLEMDSRMGDLLKELNSIEEYRTAARQLYNREFDGWVLTRSISAFQRTLMSNHSTFDKFIQTGDSSVFTPEQYKGWKLFNSAGCVECHVLPNFTSYTAANNGLYEDYGEDKGRFRVTADSADIGKFRIPSLRNIELTAPYMHDGSVKSLNQVIRHYMKDHSSKPYLDPRMEKVHVQAGDEEFLIQFLKTLTDTSYMVNFRQ